MRSAQRCCVLVLLVLVLITYLMGMGCAPTSPATQSAMPSTPPPAEFVPVFRIQVGTTLRYQVETSVTGTAPGKRIPETRQKVAVTYHVIGVDAQGTTSVRMDAEGKPFALVRIRRNGTLRDLRALSPETAGDVEALAPTMKGLPIDRPVRVGDGVPFRQRVPSTSTGLPQDIDVLGTMILSRFSPVGRCWAAEFQGALRLDLPGGGELTDPKTGTRFRLEATGTAQSRIEVQTGILVNSQAAMTLDVAALGGQPPVRARIITTNDLRLDPGSLGALGC